MAPAPWTLSLKGNSKPVGSRRGLLIWGGLLTGTGTGLFLYGRSLRGDDDRFQRADDLTPIVYQFLGLTVGAGGLISTGLYFATRGQPSQSVAVAPVYGGRDGMTGLALAGAW